MSQPHVLRLLRSRLSLAIALVNALSIGTLLTTVLPATALTSIELTDQDVLNQELRADPIRVMVNYDRSEESWSNSFSYQIFYNDTLKVEATQETSYRGVVSLQDLDQDGTVEVIAETYSGGAHCCTTHQVYSWQDGGFVETDLGSRDGEGGTFEDLNGDNRLEFISYDNAFLYTFSSYAGSFPPSQIFSFQNGAFVNTTRQYPQYLRGRAWQMYQAILRAETTAGDDTTGEINGVLAGYVAQKILLGEYQQGWDFMLARYDRQSDWGLDRVEGDRIVGQYSGFPAALRALLVQQGYLTPQDR